MTRSYFTVRKLPDGPMVNVAADIMRHLFARQYVGRTVIVCDRPNALISVARKQWLKITRGLQRDRASTINADRILALTSDITHMQHLSFVTKNPEQQPGAHVFFITPESFDLLPLNCCTVYIVSPLSEFRVAKLLRQLPMDSLIVDYTSDEDFWTTQGLGNKAVLEERIAHEWKEVLDYMEGANIDFDKLATDPLYLAKVDDTLDILLASGQHFLQVASTFFRAFDIAQPAPITAKEQQYYDMLSLLSRRVDALTPGFFSQHLARIREEQDPFLMYDSGQRNNSQILLANAINSHKQQGRVRLAQALLSAHV